MNTSDTREFFNQGMILKLYHTLINTISFKFFFLIYNNSIRMALKPLRRYNGRLSLCRSI
jgi:adenine-specific DNA methylase